MAAATVSHRGGTPSKGKSHGLAISPTIAVPYPRVLVRAVHHPCGRRYPDGHVPGKLCMIVDMTVNVPST